MPITTWPPCNVMVGRRVLVIIKTYIVISILHSTLVVDRLVVLNLVNLDHPLEKLSWAINLMSPHCTRWWRIISKCWSNMRMSKGLKVEVLKFGAVYENKFFKSKDGMMVGWMCWYQLECIYEILGYVHLRIWIFEFGNHVPIFMGVEVHWPHGEYLILDLGCIFGLKWILLDWQYKQRVMTMCKKTCIHTQTL